MDKNEAKEKIRGLIEKYELEKKSGQIKRFTEEDTKKGFIQPLFEALGWDTSDRNEVSSEEHIKSAGRIDYGFYINGRAKFFLEAKSLETDLHREEYASQAIKYSWNRGVTWAILTDFESIKVFNAEAVSKFLGDKLVFEIPYYDFLSRFDQLWQLSKESFLVESLDKYAEQIGKKLQRVPVSELLYKDLNDCRNLLLNSLRQWNSEKNISNELLEEGVQKLLDRLIFIRVLEDRGIEQSTLRPIVREWEASPDKNKIPLYKYMVGKFRELDAIYNSSLFSSHPFEDWEEYSGHTKRVIDILYGKRGYYEYDFKVMPADVLGNVYENYLGYILSKSKKGLEISQDSKKRKEQGIYYTPTFIVDYIVENSLREVLDKCKTIADVKKIKILDPACGSGSFLIKALEIMNEKYKEFGSPGDEYTKLQILTENIYGVDLDDQAIEIARLNLLISAIDTRGKLPTLSNIKNGNSLISGSDEELKKYFGKNSKEKKSFNWQERFPEVFNRENPGFDVIIGNPPYGVSLKGADREIVIEKFGKLPDFEIYYYFIELGRKILNKSGLLAYIIPNTFLFNVFADRYRRHLLEDWSIDLIVDCTSLKIFEQATVNNALIFLRNEVSARNVGYKNTNDIKSFDELVSVSTQYVTRDILLQNNQNWGLVFKLPNKVLNLIAKIRKDSKELSLFFPEISQGLIAYDKYKGQSEEVIQNRSYHYLNKTKDDLKQWLYGEDIKKYSVNWNEQEWVDYGDWIANPREQKYFQKPRVLVREITNPSIYAAYTDREFYNDPSIVNILDNPKSEISIFFLLGFLNSKLAAFYHFNSSPKATKGSFPKILVKDIREFPLKIASKEIQYQIIGLVSEIIKLNTEKDMEEKNSSKWDVLKEKIEILNKKIDEEVYRLYGLNSEDIEIVEDNGKSANRS